MKLVRKVLCCMLLLTVLVTGNDSIVSASSVSGPVVVKLGKEKTASISAESKMVVFKTELKKVGKLKTEFSVDKLGADAVFEIYRSGAYNRYTFGEKIYKYNKSKKTVSGKFTTKEILSPGEYAVKIYVNEEIKGDKKVKIKISCVEDGFEDQEKNNSEETAQKVKLDSSKKHKMMLSSLYIVGAANEYDKADCFTFTTKEAKKLKINLGLEKAVKGLQVTVTKKTEEGYAKVASFAVSGKSLNKTVNLKKKGTYYVMVEYTGDADIQIPYTISIG